MREEVIAEHQRIDGRDELHPRRRIEQRGVISNTEGDIGAMRTAIPEEAVDELELGKTFAH